MRRRKGRIGRGEEGEKDQEEVEYEEKYKYE
jgi:hypothetical protein